MKRDIIIIEDNTISVNGNEIWMTATEIAGLFHTGVPAVNAAIRAVRKPDVLNDYEVCRYMRLENGLHADEVDFLVMVYAPLEVRVERAVKRDCSSRELVMKRIEAQMSDEVKRSHADFVIVNDDETPLIPQVLELISLLSKNNHYLCSAKK